MPSVLVLPVRRVLLPGQTASYAVGKRSSIALVEHLLAELRLAAPIAGSSLRLAESARASSEALLALALVGPGGSAVLCRLALLEWVCGSEGRLRQRAHAQRVGPSGAD